MTYIWVLGGAKTLGPYTTSVHCCLLLWIRLSDVLLTMWLHLQVMCQWVEDLRKDLCKFWLQFLPVFLNLMEVTAVGVVGAALIITFLKVVCPSCQHKYVSFVFPFNCMQLLQQFDFFWINRASSHCYSSIRSHYTNVISCDIRFKKIWAWNTLKML